MRRYLILLLWGSCMVLSVQAAEPSYSCEAPDETKAAIARAGQQGIGILLAEHPEDFWIQRTYIDSVVRGAPGLRGGTGIPGGPAEEFVIERFRKGYEARPQDPESAYLYAYSLIHKDTAKSIEILNSIIQKTPAFPVAWLTLAILHGYPNYYDQIKVRKYTESFLERCSDTLELRVAPLAAQLGRSNASLAYAKGLRKRISGKADEQTVPLFENLWQLESRVALPAEKAEYQKLIEGDLKFLEGLDKAKFPDVNRLLALGYQRTGNKEAMEKLAKESPSSVPTSQLSQFFQAQSEWSRANPSPAPNANSETRIAYYKKQLQFLDEWRDKAPQLPMVLAPRITALAAIPDTPNELLIQEGNKALVALRNQTTGSLPPAAFDVLRIWAQRGLELDRVPALVKEAVASQQRTPIVSPLTQNSDLYGASYQELVVENQRWTTNTNAWAILVTAHAKKREFDPARSVLEEWERALAGRRKRAEEINEKMAQQARNAPSASTTPTFNPINSLESTIASGIRNEESRFYDASAQLAGAEGRALDALTYYQTSLRLSYGRQMTPPNILDLDNGKEANALWKKLGGTESGWRAWMESLWTIPMSKPSGGPRWSATNKAIPQFSLTDQSGKAWTLDNLKGKTTLINIWATWCGPCRAELPLLQKLYEQIKDRSDIQIITLNVDEDSKLVEPFLKENKLSMPSLYARPFVNGFAGSPGLPTTWISDATGTIRFESLGFGGSNDQWVPQTLRQIENVRDQKNPASSVSAAIAPTPVFFEKDVYTPGGGVQLPKVIHNPVPSYTEPARQAKVQGIVLLSVVVRKDGTVGSAKILRGLGYGLDESAISRITREWRFQPGSFNGQPVDVQVNIEVSFRLK